MKQDGLRKGTGVVRYIREGIIDRCDYQNRIQRRLDGLWTSDNGDDNGL